VISGSVRHLVLLVGTGPMVFSLIDQELRTSIGRIREEEYASIYIHACMERARILVHDMCDLESGCLDLAGTSLLFFRNKFIVFWSMFGF